MATLQPSDLEAFSAHTAASARALIAGWIPAILGIVGILSSGCALGMGTSDDDTSQTTGAGGNIISSHGSGGSSSTGGSAGQTSGSGGAGGQSLAVGGSGGQAMGGSGSAGASAGSGGSVNVGGSGGVGVGTGGSLPQSGGSAGQNVGGAGSGGTASTGGSSGSGEGGAAGGTAGPGESPAFTTAEQLCAYVNDSRATSQGHQRWRGLPWKGEYHNAHYWPTQFMVDASLSAAAQAEADALANGAGPKGSPSTDGEINGNLLHQYLYVDGVDTSDYTVSSQQLTGDWISGSFKAGLINANGTARMALYYHDTGDNAHGPKLTRIGCGGAFKAADQSTWWVIKLSP